MKRILKPEHVTAIIDSREQLPYDLAPLSMLDGTLNTGDYSVLGLEHLVAVERKSLDDMLGCVGRDRDRFEREIARLRGFEAKAIVIEASWDDVDAGVWRSKVKPAQLRGSLIAWMTDGVPLVLAGTRDQAALFVSRFLFTAARRRYGQLLTFLDAMEAKNEGDQNARKA